MNSLTKLSILSITSELPWPLDTGGKLRTFHIHRALAEVFDLRLIVPVESIQQEPIDKLMQYGIQVLPVVVGARKTINESLKTLTAALFKEPYVLYRRHNHELVRKQILKTARIKMPDLIYLDHLDSLLYRKLLPDCPASLDLHNIYSLIVERYATEQSNPLKKYYFQRETRLLKRIEQSLAETNCMVFAVSESEVEYYQRLGIKSVHLIPNGVDCSQFALLPCGRTGTGLRLMFLGTMSWGPNADAADTLVKHIFPEVRSKRPDAELWIVGRNPPTHLIKHHHVNGVHVTGGVPDIVPYYQNAQFLVVPLESGGGTRLKILEAFAAGLPVISTPIGIEGIQAQDGIHLAITDQQHFAKKILELIDNQELTQQQAARARTLVEELYDWKNIGKIAVQTICNHIEALKK